LGYKKEIGLEKMFLVGDELFCWGKTILLDRSLVFGLLVKFLFRVNFWLGGKLLSQGQNFVIQLWV